jgi:3-deoxy-D-manno-octulosonic-acid transferase
VLNWLYNFVLLTSSPFWLPWALGKKIFSTCGWQVIAQKMGFFPAEVLNRLEGEPRIWVHAVSMGEVSAIHPLVRQIRETYPKACIILSTGTESGQAVARERVSEATGTIYFPLDFPFVVRRVIRKLGPFLFILAETELWPNFLRIAKEEGVRTLWVNGRISDRSYPRYRKTRFFWRGVLDHLDFLSMIRVEDGERAIAIGANPVRVFANGNCKLDQAYGAIDPQIVEGMRRLLAIQEGERIFVAGSTHEGEEEIILRAFRRIRGKYPALVLILIPRHIDRVPRIERILRQEGFHDYVLRSELERTGRSGRSIVLWDTFGELFKVYSVATIVFCGGSLVPRRGQNLMEPSAWGKVVLYGPSFDDFRDAHEILEKAGAGIVVRNEEEIIERSLYLLGHPQELERRGEAGREALRANLGATAKNLALVKRLIGK